MSSVDPVLVLKLTNTQTNITLARFHLLVHSVHALSLAGGLTFVGFDCDRTVPFHFACANTAITPPTYCHNSSYSIGQKNTSGINGGGRGTYTKNVSNLKKKFFWHIFYIFFTATVY